jgi:hypothetical protein
MGGVQSEAKGVGSHKIHCLAQKSCLVVGGIAVKWTQQRTGRVHAAEHFMWMRCASMKWQTTPFKVALSHVTISMTALSALTLWRRDCSCNVRRCAPFWARFRICVRASRILLLWARHPRLSSSRRHYCRTASHSCSSHLISCIKLNISIICGYGEVCRLLS